MYEKIMASPRNLFSAMSLSGLINLFMPMSIAINSNCDYYQEMVLGQQYYIYNPEYPRKYEGETACRWTARSAANTRIVVTCEDIDLPTTTNCQEDRLVISSSGSNEFRGDIRSFCGKGSLSSVSDSNKITIGLFATRRSLGGRFLCTMMAIATTHNTTQTSPLLSCDCGWHQRPRIVNGTNTGVNEFPAMAGLVDLIRRELTCGITIISKKYLVTAAHCFISDTEARHYAVLVGDHDIATGEDTEYSKLYQADKLKIHPKYNSNTKENDIAIVKTRQSIQFSFAVGPICLPFRYSFRTFVGANVIALGWGQLFFGGPKADILQKVNLTVVSNAFCQQEVTDRIFSSEICTYSLYKDSCMGDSGGPILWYDDTMLSSQRLFLLGVISFGSACANEIPAVNTRITSYLAWIISETSDADYCIR